MHNSTLSGNVNFSVLALESPASWITSCVGIYRRGGLLLPKFLSHSWGFNPVGVAFVWLIVGRAALSLVPMNWATKELLGVSFTVKWNLCLGKQSAWIACKLLLCSGCRTSIVDWVAERMSAMLKEIMQRSGQNTICYCMRGHANGYCTKMT